MRRGFTLMELIIVIIIVGILATVGFGQYRRIVERGRAAEAKAILGQIRTAQEAYRTEFGAFAADIITNARSILNEVSIPEGACDLAHYFSYAVDSPTPDTFTATASRCQGGGKAPDVVAADAYDITLDETGTLGVTPGFEFYL